MPSPTSPLEDMETKMRGGGGPPADPSSEHLTNTDTEKNSREKRGIFGQAIKYLPSRRDTTDGVEKFAPKMVDGIFINHVFSSGGRWKGEYNVILWEKACEARTPQEIGMYRIKERFIPETVCFPFLEKSDELKYPEILLNKKVTDISEDDDCDIVPEDLEVEKIEDWNLSETNETNKKNQEADLRGGDSR